jgi:hypothetical protein
MTKSIATLSMVVIAASLATAALAGDTDLLANCIAGRERSTSD